MKIAFHGAARTVTGSKHLITLKSGTKILLDCGLFQGLGRITEELNSQLGSDSKARKRRIYRCYFLYTRDQRPN